MKLRYKITGGLLAVVVLAAVAGAVVVSHTAACGPATPPAEDSVAMRAVVYRCYGPPEVLELAAIPRPVPADNEVLVRISAASVNPLDWHYMRGEPYLMRLLAGIGRPDEPRLGVDFAGTIEAVGAGVQGYRPGDQVFGGRTGAFAEYVTVGADRALARKPDNVSFEQAASVPIAAITALQALRDKGRLEAGQKVLVNGASGGVGTFAVQIAKAMGAEVTGVCSTRNVDLVRSIGADHVIDYTREDYTRGDTRYDLIVDMVGSHSLLANRRVLEPDGRMVLVGGGKGNWIGPLLVPLRAMLLAPFVSQEFISLLAHMDKDDLAELAGMMQSGEITPVIDRHYALGDIAAAIAYSEEGHARGKIVIDIGAAKH